MRHESNHTENHKAGIERGKTVSERYEHRVPLKSSTVKLVQKFIGLKGVSKPKKKTLQEEVVVKFVVRTQADQASPSGTEKNQRE